MCDSAWILDNWGSLFKGVINGRGYVCWMYRLGMQDRSIVQEVATWGHGRVGWNRHERSLGPAEWQTYLYGKNLLRFLEYNEPCMTNDAKREIVLDAIADLRAKYGVLV